jgi:hypothetical protein
MEIDLDIDLNIDLDIKMQALNMDDNSYENTKNNLNDIEENEEEDENLIEITDTIITDMQKLSIDEKAELMYDLFDNNLDIYSVYYVFNSYIIVYFWW